MQAFVLAFAIAATAAQANEQLTVQAEEGSWALDPSTTRLYLDKNREPQIDMQVRYVNAPKQVDEVFRYAVTGCKHGTGKLGMVNSEGEFTAKVHVWTTADLKVADELAMKLCAAATEVMSK